MKMSDALDKFLEELVSGENPTQYGVAIKDYISVCREVAGELEISDFFTFFTGASN